MRNCVAKPVIVDENHKLRPHSKCIRAHLLLTASVFMVRSWGAVARACVGGSAYRTRVVSIVYAAHHCIAAMLLR